MGADDQIPGDWTIAEWKPEPTRPLQIVEADVYRTVRGSFGPPAYVIVRDAGGQEYQFGFDSFLCRLFAGSRYERDANAAWVVADSVLEAEFSELVRAAVREQSDWSWLARYLDRALSWGKLRTHSRSSSD